MSARTHLPSGLVTFLFTDIEGSTRMARLLGPGYRPVLREHRRLLRVALSAGGGAELFTEGDSFFVAFADAVSALTACADAQRALASHEWPAPQARPRVRMGLHTGYAEPCDGEYATAEVHRAARVAAAAHGGQVLCSAATAHGARRLPPDAWLLDLGLHRLRGFDDRERLYQLVARGLERQFPRPRTADARTDNLPGQVTSFVGRNKERAELGGLVSAHRLVTVVGAGGAGKTRLAVQLAGDRLDAHPDGVWFVDLAAITDPGLVAVAVAAVLGIRPEPGRPVLETVVDHVGSRRLLLVLDTCDGQLAASAQVVARLLRGCRDVRILATSREPLGLPGEVVWRIPPLSLGGDPRGGPGDAVALLLDRIRVARGDHTADEAEHVHLLRVASRLDGLPLAIELAAARARMMSVAELAGRLDAELPGQPGDMLSTLDAGRARPVPGEGGRPAVADTHPDPASGRHATMQAAVTWSYRTLGPGPARLLRWLAAFAGPVTMPTMRWLLDDDPLDPVAVLVDKSLVQAEPGLEGTTYRLLHPIKAYAARRLAEAGEETLARERHAIWSLQAVTRVRASGYGHPVPLSPHALDPLADEVRAALRWTVTGGSARLGLRLAGGLDQWWRERGLAREGRLWLFRLYGRIAETGEAVPEAELAAAYHVHSLHAGADGEYAEELRFSQRAEAEARQAGDAGLLARVLGGRGRSLMDAGRFDEAERVCREAIDWSVRHGVPADGLSATTCLAQLLWRRGALDEAADMLGAARALEAMRPAERGHRTVDMLLGMVALVRGDLVAAHEHLTVALRSRIGNGFQSRACETLEAFAVRCGLGGERSIAVRLFGAAQSNRTRLRGSPGPFGPYWRSQQAALRSAMGDEAFDRAYARGGELDLDAAAAMALRIEHPDLAAGSRRFTGAGPVVAPATGPGVPPFPRSPGPI